MVVRAALSLAVSPWMVWRGIGALRFRGRVLPTLAALGRMKVNSKVPPTVCLCGAFATYGYLPTISMIPCRSAPCVRREAQDAGVDLSALD